MAIMAVPHHILGKGSDLRGGWALRQAAQSSGHGTKLQEFKERLDSALRLRVFFFGLSCMHPGVGPDGLCVSLPT